jgi:DNA-binding GntR family transcriptional regulator
MRTRAPLVWHEALVPRFAKDLCFAAAHPAAMEHSLPYRRSPGQRAYEQLRTAVLNGDLRAGHIDIQQVADRFGVSPTPVREALARLASEQLITFTPGHGYAITHASAKALGDLYVWTDRVVRLALEFACEHDASSLETPDTARSWGAALIPATRYAQEVSSLFEEIAQAPSNSEFVSKIAQSNARLFRARTVEWSVLSGVQEEVSQLILLWRAGQIDDLGAKIGAYHLRRIDQCEEIARTLSQTGIAPVS